MCPEGGALRKLLLFSLLLVLFFALAANATQTIITFDDLGFDQVVPDGYAGVTWYAEWNAYQEPQDPYNPHSPPFRVYDFLNDGHFTFSTPVVFDGAWFSGYDFATVQFQGYLGGVLQFTSGILAPSDVSTFLASGYSGLVDDIHVLSPSPDFFVMDDVTYEGAATTPEPASLLLLGTGIAGIAGYVRRRIF